MRPIRKVSFKFGAKEAGDNLEIEPEGTTLFVGPNNSGKSLVLREIEQYCATANSSHNKVLASLELEVPEFDDVMRDLSRRASPPAQNENPPNDGFMVQRLTTFKGHNPREPISENQIKASLKASNFGYLSRFYFSLLTVRLDGATRTKLLDPKPQGDLLNPPTNVLAALWQESEIRQRLRDITSDAFGSFFVIDALQQGQLRARLSDKKPDNEEEEQALSLKSREFHRAAMEITDASDGVKAFTGMVATVLAHDCKIPLIDEPEAFLHPPLAKRLGRELAVISEEKEACAFLATHSADFLMGCLQGSRKLNIVRLTHKKGKSTARLLRHERLSEIIRSPIMRSTGVLSALFHEGAVVCEADSDCALYQEINERLLQHEQDGGAEAVFLNAHNKQSTSTIAGPLREMGIPAAIAIDFDCLKIDTEFNKLLTDLKVPTSIARGWMQSRSIIAQYCREIDLDWKRKGVNGIEDSQIKESVHYLLTSLASYGVFVVPGGELESWLSGRGLDEVANKRTWLLRAFEKLGESSECEGYALPSDGDVWDFLRHIAAWINNPNRLGV